MRGAFPAVALFLAATVFLFFRHAQASTASSVAGGAVFEARKCSICHQVKGPAREKALSDQLRKKGPELWYAGDKFMDGFLANWLRNPVPIRPMAYNSITEKNKGDHPRLDDREAGDVASYLMGLKSPHVTPLGATGPEDIRKGRIVFVNRQSCYGCHRVMEKERVVGGSTGPSLVSAADRLQPGWVYSYLSNPRAFKPVRDMPDYTGYLDDSEMKGLAAYISTFR